MTPHISVRRKDGDRNLWWGGDCGPIYDYAYRSGKQYVLLNLIDPYKNSVLSKSDQNILIRELETMSRGEGIDSELKLSIESLIGFVESDKKRVIEFVGE